MASISAPSAFVEPIAASPDVSIAVRPSREARSARLKRALRLVRLTLEVHADAFCFAPLLYLQGMAWRMRRLRVRSRNRIASLTGRSPRAYALWIEHHETRARARFEHGRNALVARIRPVIDCRSGLEGLEETLASLGSDCDRPIVIGDHGVSATIQIRQPGDLAAVLRDSDWALPVSPGDRLAPSALAIYAAACDTSPSSVIYADDDLIGPDGARYEPHFKPDWNPELLEHHDFVSGAAVIRCHRRDIEELPEQAWTKVLIERAVSRDGAGIHIRTILHHRRSRPSPRIPARPSSLLRGPTPSVSAIIPTRNRHDLLRTCIQGLEETAYRGIEIIVVDNDSDDRESLGYLTELERCGVRVLRVPGAFNFSALNNAAVRHATSDLLCFLNNDVEMIDGDWLSLLIPHALKPNIGAVGARLLYPDGTIQHAGVFTGIGGGAAHAHRFKDADEAGYFDRARLPQRVSAVTGACLLVQREKFLAVGGLDEEKFPVAFNDVDLCLKLNSRGWQSFYEPRATLIHHESRSRGSDASRANRSRFARELAALKSVWNTDKFIDPFHHPHLSPFCEQFLIAI